MLGTITPLGERSRGTVWGRTITAYFIGSAVAGIVSGGLAGAFGAALGIPSQFTLSVRSAMLAGGLVLGVLIDSGALGLSRPSPRRQVNDQWLYEYRGWVYGVAFGAQLGLGLVTIVTASTIYLVLPAAFLSGAPRTGAIIGLTFALVRAAPVLATAGAMTHAEVARKVATVDGWATIGKKLGWLAQLLIAALLIVPFIGFIPK